MSEPNCMPVPPIDVEKLTKMLTVFMNYCPCFLTIIHPIRFRLDRRIGEVKRVK